MFEMVRIFSRKREIPLAYDYFRRAKDPRMQSDGCDRIEIRNFASVDGKSTVGTSRAFRECSNGDANGGAPFRGFA